jgi:hypothetical protein
MPARRPGPSGQTPDSPALARLRRRLERLELTHLRSFIEEQRTAIEALQAELADTQRRLSWAEDNADRWRDDFLQAIDHAGATPGLTVDGQVVALQPEARH